MKKSLFLIYSILLIVNLPSCNLSSANEAKTKLLERNIYTDEPDKNDILILNFNSEKIKLDTSHLKMELPNEVTIFIDGKKFNKNIGLDRNIFINSNSDNYLVEELAWDISILTPYGNFSIPESYIEIEEGILMSGHFRIIPNDKIIHDFDLPPNWISSDMMATPTGRQRINPLKLLKNVNKKELIPISEIEEGKFSVIWDREILKKNAKSNYDAIYRLILSKPIRPVAFLEKCLTGKRLITVVHENQVMEEYYSDSGKYNRNVERTKQGRLSIRDFYYNLQNNKEFMQKIDMIPECSSEDYDIDRFFYVDHTGSYFVEVPRIPAQKKWHIVQQASREMRNVR